MRAPDERLRRLQLAARSIILVGLVALVAQGAWWAAHTRWQPWDDEGSLLLQLRRFGSGQRPYLDIPSNFGPAWFLARGAIAEVLGGMSHSHARLGTWIAHLLLSAGLGLCCWRLTRALPLAIWGALQAAGCGISLSQEPIHPQELCVLLVSAALLAALSAGDARPRLRLAGWMTLGACAGLLLAVKVNIGVYLIAALGLVGASRLPSGRARQVILGLAGATALALPLLLMRRRLDGLWVMSLALSIEVALLALVLELRRAECEGDLGERVGSAAAMLLCLGVPALSLACGGVPLSAQLRACLIAPLSFADRRFLPGDPGAWPFAAALASLLLLTLERWLRRGGPALALKAIGATALTLTLPGDETGLISGLPFCWIALRPLPGLRAGPTLAQRRLLVAIAAFQALVAYPVSGSQARWAALPLIPVAAILWIDAWRGYAAWRGFSNRGPRAAAQELALSLGVGAALLVSAFPLAQLSSRYESATPLGLPGTEGVRDWPRLSAPVVHVVENLRAHAGALHCEPGIPSLHLWSERPPLDPQVYGWSFAFRDAEVEARIAARLEADPRAILVWDEAVLRFWSQGIAVAPGPLQAWRSKARREMQVGRFELYVDPERGPLDRFLLFTPRRFGPGLPAIPAPQGLLEASSQWTLAGWLEARPEASGPLLTARGAAGERRWRLELKAGALTLRWPRGELRRALSGEARVAIISSADGLRLWVDGEAAGPAAPSPQAGEWLWLGGDDPRLVAPHPAQARLSRWVVSPTALSDVELAALFERHPLPK